jgi:hypothetical protein
MGCPSRQAPVPIAPMAAADIASSGAGCPVHSSDRERRLMQQETQTAERNPPASRTSLCSGVLAGR